MSFFEFQSVSLVFPDWAMYIFLQLPVIHKPQSVSVYIHFQFYNVFSCLGFTSKTTYLVLWHQNNSSLWHPRE